MTRNNSKLAVRMLAATALALSLLGVSSVVAATTIEWNGVTFQTQGDGTASVDSDGNLLLTPTGTTFALHVNRLPSGGSAPSPVNANGTPFVSFSYIDPGVESQKIDFSIQDETVVGQPRIQAGSLFSAGQYASATYGVGADRNTNEEFLFFTSPRAAASHSVVLGKTADSTLYASFDGEQRSSDIFKAAGIDFDFNDILLRVRNGAGSTFVFTSFTFGDNFSPSAQVSEPGSLGLFGLGGILLMLLARGRRNPRLNAQAA